MSKRRQRMSRFQAEIEVCEPRVLLSTYTVTTTADAGTGSLRQAILDANGHVGADIIDFQIPSTGTPTIHPLTPLPIISDPVTIDGYSQAAKAIPSTPFWGTLPALPAVQISGDLIASNSHGALDVQTHDCVIAGLTINQFSNGPAPYDVQISGANNHVLSDFLGTGPGGEKGLSANGIGVEVDHGDGTVIRDDLIAAQSTDGVRVNDSSSVLILDNAVGLDLNQTIALGNGAGVEIFGDSSSCKIDGNIVCGSTNNGISSFSTLTAITNNLVGVTLNQAAVIGNGGFGIFAGGGSPDITANVVCGSAKGGINVAPLAVRAEVNSNTVGQTFGPGGRTNKAGAGNHGDGILISAPAATVGADSLSGNDVENSTGNGITLSGNGATAIGNSVGATTAGARGNGGAGIQINGNNVTVGTDAHLLDPAPNLIGGNATGIVVNGTNDIVQMNDIGENQGNPFPNGMGIDLQGAFNASVQGNVISGNHGDGIVIEKAARNNSIAGNAIGIVNVGRSTSHALPNSGDGVRVLGTSNGIGNLVAFPNVISANGGAGVDLFGNSNAVANNYIGTDIAGNAALGNSGPGIHVERGAVNEIIGGSAADPSVRNLISGNHGAGIFLDHANQNTILNNLIGTNAAGTAALGNGGDGILVTGSANLIGPDVKLATNPTDAGANVIAFNHGAGVNVAYDSAHGFGVSNRITGNSIFSNTGLGIDLGGDGITPNDAGDVDSGPNNLQNYPLLTGATSYLGQTHVAGSFSGAAIASFYLDFYASPAADPSGFGEGKQWIGDISITTDSTGHASFDALLPHATTPGWLVSATATTPPGFLVPALNPGNTSEFSKAVAVAGITIHINVPTQVILAGAALGGSVGTTKLPFGVPTGVSVNVSWGDGSTSGAQLALRKGTSDTYDVLASHIYPQGGKFKLTITLLKNGKKVTSSAAQVLVSPAVGLLPGELTQPPAMTLAQDPTLGGVVLEDLTLNIRGIASGGAFAGTLEERVVRDDATGTLDFYYRVTNNAGSIGSIQSLSVSNFAGFSTTVGYRTDGVGDTGLSVATRSSNGSAITLTFAGGVQPGHSTYSAIVRTNATHFNSFGQVTVAGINLSGPEPII